MKRVWSNEYADHNGVTTLTVFKSGVRFRTVRFSTCRRPEVESYRWLLTGCNSLQSSDSRRLSLKSLLATNNPHNRNILHRNGDTDDFTDQNLWVPPLPEYFELSDGSYAIVVPFLMEGREVQFIDYGLPAAKIEEIKRYLWYPTFDRGVKSYRLQALVKRRYLYLHRIVTGAQPGQVVDHEYGITEHNQLDRLRVVDHTVNNRNVRKRKDNSSGFTGVGWNIVREAWAARVGVCGKRRCVGYFSDPLEAAHARDNFIRQLPTDQRLGFCFNFPQGDEPSIRPKKVA